MTLLIRSHSNHVNDNSIYNFALLTSQKCSKLSPSCWDDCTEVYFTRLRKRNWKWCSKEVRCQHFLGWYLIYSRGFIQLKVKRFKIVTVEDTCGRSGKCHKSMYNPNRQSYFQRKEVRNYKVNLSYAYPAVWLRGGQFQHFFCQIYEKPN